MSGAGSSAAGRSPAPLREDPYGTLKRLSVFREWVLNERRRNGGRALRILDYGCGTGLAVALPLAEDGHRVHGVDPHEPSIAWARERVRANGLSFGTETAADLRGRGERYGVVICSEVLEHLEDPGACLAELGALLEPGGALFVTVPNGRGCFERLRVLEAWLARLGLASLIDHVAWRLHAAHWRLRGRGIPPRPGSEPVAPQTALTLNVHSAHVQAFRLASLERLFRERGLTVETRRARSLVCGPYADFWMALLSFGGWLYALNNALADRLPLAWAADWMFRLRASGPAPAPAADAVAHE